jgi:hypothetical protein
MTDLDIVTLRELLRQVKAQAAVDVAAMNRYRAERDALQVANSVEFDRAEAAEAALARVRALCDRYERSAFEPLILQVRAAAALPEARES